MPLLCLFNPSPHPQPPPPLKQQLYHTESLHPQAHPVIHAVIKEAIKQTLRNYNFSNIYVLPCSLHYLLAYLHFLLFNLLVREFYI